MGALTDKRKRSSADLHSTSSLSSQKKPRLMPVSSSPMSPNISKPPPFIRLPHAPQPTICCFGLGSPHAKRRNPPITTETEKFFSPFVLKKRSERLELDFEEYKQLVEERSAFLGDVRVKARSSLEKSLSPDLQTRNETEVLDGSDVTSHKAEDGGNLELDSGQMSEARIFMKPKPLYKELYEKTKVRDDWLNDLDCKVKLQQQRVIGLRIESESLRKLAKKSREEVGEFFHPLTLKEEEDISDALINSNSHKVLIAHKSSNIEITREALQCLRPGAWLNDEVINLYLELLKEREKRNPKKFLRCHYFNTFFFKKLISEKQGYDFKAVKRWTTQRKLGYALIECDKIFVPIHKDIHWCLAVINVKDESFQYLDSLGGLDKYVLKMLARYFKDEVRDKNAKEIDTLNWKKESVDDLPLQKNGWDCGMFMLKYADFCSRGLNMCFSQEHMTYFRRKTVMELLRLRVD